MMSLADLKAEQTIWDNIANDECHADATRRVAVMHGNRCQLFIDAAKLRGEN